MASSSKKELAPMCIYLADRKVKLKKFGADELEKCLAPSQDLKKLKVVVISVAGRFRQGKSFLLNFLIKYLQAKGASDWLNNNDKLEGFEWRNSRKRVTQGVLLWPEVFRLRRSDGEEVAVLLMDTQGVFDTETTVSECTAIFSFSVLLSSIQIFNIKQNIQGDDLSQLELFTKYGQLVANSKKSEDSLSSSDKAPFQDLVFLVRDWSYVGDATYGWEGGHVILDEELNKSGLTGELKSMRDSIKTSFSTARCYLLPHPGKKVDSSKDFEGAIEDIDPDFLAHLRTFVESVLDPKNLKTKRLNGQDVTLGDFFVHVQTYADILESDCLPTPSTLYEATMNATNNAVLQKCIDHYYEQISKRINEAESLEDFELAHGETSDDALKLFETSLKMGDQSHLEKLREQLKKQIHNTSTQLRALNAAIQLQKRYAKEIENLRKAQLELEKEVKTKGELTEHLKVKLQQVESKHEDMSKKLAYAVAKADEAKNAALSNRSIFKQIGDYITHHVRKIFRF